MTWWFSLVSCACSKADAQRISAPHHQCAFADNTIIGQCGFTGPPSADEMVEIAYGIAPGYQNRGHATEAAQELIAYAFASGRVRTIRGHTLPQHNPSTRVLRKCGFTLIGEVTHSEDGIVWRWEMTRQKT